MKIDLRWSVPRKNQLWLKWKDISIISNTTIKLVDPEMFGPVLADCITLEKSGYINLDLTKHFIVLIPNPYIVKLTWNELLTQTKEKIIFKEAYLEDPLGHLQRISKTDLILLDCTSHTTEEEGRGKYLAAYQSLVYKDTFVPYEFF